MNKSRIILWLLLISNLFSPVVAIFSMPQPAVAQQCSGIRGNFEVVNRNEIISDWFSTGQTQIRGINMVFTLWRRTQSWEEWQVYKDTTGCPYSEQILRRQRRVYAEEWRGPIGY